MAKIQFFPFETTYRIIDDKSVIHIFGRLSTGKQICVVDSSFRPYFYLKLKKRSDFENLKKKLLELSIEKNKHNSFVIDAEPFEKKLNGKKIDVIKVYANQPRDIPVIRAEVREWDDVEDTYEYDILFSRKYLIDKKLTPLTLTEAEGDFINQRSKVSVFKAEKIHNLSDDSLSEIKILAFDLETYSVGTRVAEPEKNPILMVAFYSKGYKKVITWKKFRTDHKYVEFVDSEASLINRFKDILNNVKPDILVGYFSDGFDFPYLRTRAKKHKIKLDLSLDFSEVKFKAGSFPSADIAGIVHLDVYKFIRKIASRSLETDSYSLDSVANELLGEKKIQVDIENLADVWDNKPNELEIYAEYNLHDSKLTHDLTVKVLPNIIELVKLVGLGLFDISRMGFSQLVEWYLMRFLQDFNEIAPNKPKHDDIAKRRAFTYKGAFVYKPEPGLYKDIVIFDFRSLYPSIISSHNISPDTINCGCCKGKAELIPLESDGKYWFCKNRKGFIPTILEDVISRRSRIKGIISRSTDDKKNILLDARQNSLKLLANSFYGYLGFYASRWYSVESARSITALGRHYIKDVINKAEKSGFKVIYSDTDSIFMTLDGQTKNDAKKFVEKVNLELPELMELDYEGFYPSGLFVSAKAGEYGAKKKYALLSDDGMIKIKGFEMVRRNWSPIAKEVQENVIKIILKEDNVKKAVKYVKGIVHDLKNKTLPLEKVIIVTQLQKNLDDYDAIGPHVAAAKRMDKKGIPVGPGSIIRFVITSGKEKIRDRARLPDEISKQDYDPEYYINNQVIPAVDRILGILGFDKGFLMENKDQSKLKHFF